MTTTITATAAKGTSPYQYSIDGGPYQADNTFTKGIGTYKISAKDANGCIAELNITLKGVPADLELTASSPDVKCGETTVTITAEATKGTAPYLYAIDGGTFQAGNTFTKPAGTLAPLPPGHIDYLKQHGQISILLYLEMGRINYVFKCVDQHEIPLYDIEGNDLQTLLAGMVSWHPELKPIPRVRE